MSEALPKTSHRPPIVSLTATNLFAIEESERGLCHFIYDDLINNLIIVSIAGMFTNSTWRLMNLYGISVSHNKMEIIIETIYEIATVVWGICTMIDIIRQYITAWNLTHNISDDDQQSVIQIKSSISIKKAIYLGFKFFGGCVGWTVGYEFAADDHQLHSDKHFENVIYHAVGAAIGTFFGLLLSVELLGYWEKYILCNKHEDYQNINHRGAFGVAWKGILEGAIWSVLGDLNIYKRIHILNNNQNIAYIIDALIVGVSASIGFSVMGIFSSYFGYYYLKYQDKKNAAK